MNRKSGERFLVVSVIFVFAALSIPSQSIQSYGARSVFSQRSSSSQRSAITLVPHHLKLGNGEEFDLNVPTEFKINIAAEGLKRVRFMAMSPDNRVFVTDMYNLTDNRKGVIYVLDRFDRGTGIFRRITPFMTGLRNPNSVAFYTGSDRTSWFYLALTDKLVRYRYVGGEVAPVEKPEVLATFPDYGLAYKYGGWHLTRTIAVGGNGKIYVSVGSSCNACEEKEPVRASVIEMNPDGSDQHQFAHGIRNAVGLKWINGKLWATDMGADHLGDDRPADTFYLLKDGMNYGWPYCYQTGTRVVLDPQFNSSSKKLDCKTVPRAFAPIDSHSSPLGFEYFDASWGPLLSDSFLVSLHGSTRKSLGHGYRVARVRAKGDSHIPEDFITGFIKGGKVYGRPADIMKFGEDGFLLTDDHAGVIYYVSKR